MIFNSTLDSQVPGAFLLLGQGSGGSSSPAAPHPDTSYALHHPKFAMDEDVLNTGVALHTHLAMQSLKELAAARQ